MAPGLFHHKQPTKQSDLYALGIVLYEVATGREPFGGVPDDGLQAAAELVPPSKLCPEIEPALERAILQCLEKDPARRPESAQAVAALLAEQDSPAAVLTAAETAETSAERIRVSSI
jgi:serine/threonine-protein kinase